ncbi:mannosyltransferase [Gonapodya sp. JEL0774]|nr:mannosyltransferase [Gonapodya sp. JEL0774]
MYHALSLADAGLMVNLVGYPGTSPFESILAHKQIVVHFIPTPKKLQFSASSQRISRLLAQLFYVSAAIVRVLVQIWQVLRLLLLSVPSADFILIQNPPAIPTFAIVHIVAILHASRIVVDWHNLGYSILALTLTPASSQSREPSETSRPGIIRSAIVEFATLYERLLGTNGVYAHFTVTSAMKEKLKKEWRVRAPIHVVYDKPPRDFYRLTKKEAREFLSGFNPGVPLNESNIALSPQNFDPESSSRPAILVTSSSYTEDDDFSTLLRALALYSARASNTMPDLLVFVTGRGPLKDRWEARIRQGIWEDERMPLPALTAGTSTTNQRPLPDTYRKIRLHTVFLAQSDYPKLLGCADLGVCLHASSSGLDLPMKVVDLFGCGTPVAALGYPCLDELVKDGSNGLVFTNSDQLAEQLLSTFRSFPKSTPELDSMRRNIAVEFAEGNRWTENWTRVARPVFGIHQRATGVGARSGSGGDSIK